jgi:hypothetical protein
VGEVIWRAVDRCIEFPDAKPLPAEGRDGTLIRLMEHLHSMNDIPSKECRTWLEIVITRIANKFRIVSGLFGGMFIATTIMLYFHITPGIINVVSLTNLLLLNLTVLCWLSLDAMIPVIMICAARKFIFRLSQIRLAHDLFEANTLQEFGNMALKDAEQWLSIEIERSNARMRFVFGGPDKIAIFALGGVAWGLWKLIEENSIKTPSTIDFIPNNALLIGLGGLFGLLLGGFRQNLYVSKLCYQRNVVVMAIHRLEGLNVTTDKF